MRTKILTILALAMLSTPALAAEPGALGQKDQAASWESCCSGDIGDNKAACDTWAEAEAAKILGTTMPAAADAPAGTTTDALGIK